jgi:hypothetical protein
VFDLYQFVYYCKIYIVSKSCGNALPEEKKKQSKSVKIGIDRDKCPKTWGNKKTQLLWCTIFRRPDKQFSTPWNKSRLTLEQNYHREEQKILTLEDQKIFEKM